MNLETQKTNDSTANFQSDTSALSNHKTDWTQFQSALAYVSSGASAAQYLPSLEISSHDMAKEAKLDARSLTADMQSGSFSQASQEFSKSVNDFNQLDPSAKDQKSFSRHLIHDIVRDLAQVFSGGSSDSTPTSTTDAGTAAASSPATDSGIATASSPATDSGIVTAPVIGGTASGAGDGATLTSNQSGSGDTAVAIASQAGAAGADTLSSTVAGTQVQLDGGTLTDGQIFPNASYLYQGDTGATHSLGNTLNNYSIGINTVGGSDSYGINVQVADGSHGWQTFTDNSFGTSQTVSIPIPADGFKPTTGSDHHDEIIGPTSPTDPTLRAYDVWGMETDGNGNPTGRVGTVTSSPLGGDGSGSSGGSGVAANISELAGTILPGEIQAAMARGAATGNYSLGHALSGVMDISMLAPGVGSAIPARYGDGITNGAPIQEGDKLFLPTSFDVSNSNLTPEQKVIAATMQQQGIMVTDKGNVPGGIALYSDLQAGTAPDLSGLRALTGQLVLETSA